MRLKKALFPLLLLPIATAVLLHGQPARAADEEERPADDQPAAEQPARDPLAETDSFLGKIVVTAKRVPERSFDTPYIVDTVEMNDFAAMKQYRTPAEALRDVPGVMVQKTGYAQGSPYIRGLTSYHNVHMIDGIRLNNSIWRPGPNQWFNHIDNWTVDRYEVVKGPASVLYGSDAVGGAINAVTRKREKWTDGFNWHRTLYYRFSSAERSNAGRMEVSGNYGKTLGITVGGSVKGFGDLDGGGGIGVMDKTGYNTYNGDLKIEYFLSPDKKVTFAHYTVAKRDAWRTHKTRYGFSWEGSAVGSEDKRVLDECHNLTYLKYDEKNIGSGIDELHLSFSWQRLTAEQHRVRWGRGRPIDDQGTLVDTVGLDVQMVSKTPIGRLTYGVDWYHDNVSSWKREYFANGALARKRIQGPVGDNGRYDIVGIYLQDEIPVGERGTLTLGGRFTHVEADVNNVQAPGNWRRKISIHDNWDAAVGNARFNYILDEQEHWNAFAGVSQAFRAPNLADLSRLDSARSGEIETPVTNLDPEWFITYEAGLKSSYENVEGQLAWFYTDINDMIIRAATGNIVDGDREVTKKNVGFGYLTGLELSTRWRFLPQWTAFGSFAWHYGSVVQYPSSAPIKEREPLSRLMPATGQFGVRWDRPDRKLWFELGCTAAGHQDHFPTRDALDSQRIPPGGTPGYVTVDLRGGWRPVEGLELWAAVENVTNEAYRIVGSGVNEPGINFIAGAKWEF